MCPARFLGCKLQLLVALGGRCVNASAMARVATVFWMVRSSTTVLYLDKILSPIDLHIGYVTAI